MRTVGVFQLGASHEVKQGLQSFFTPNQRWFSILARNGCRRCTNVSGRISYSMNKFTCNERTGEKVAQKVAHSCQKGVTEIST